jgi:peptidyl-prolyl cis-trans isomerase A (cyclophilin A)
MIARRLFLALSVALALPAAALAANPKVRLETAQGAIVIELYADKAPITAANFLRYTDRGLFNGARFYRASRPPNYTATDYGSIQGGLQNDPKKILPPIAHESTIKTGLKHINGTISMGRHAPGTAQADFFITLGEQTYLDADPKDPKNPGFAAFGQVVEGIEVVQKIIGLPVDPNAGTGAMKGEMLKVPVRITKVSRYVEPPKPAVAAAPAATTSPTQIPTPAPTPPATPTPTP